MLSNRTAGQPSPFVIPAVDVNGDAITASAAAWEIFDEDGGSIATGAATIGSGEVTFTVTANDLTLAEGVSSAGRELVVALTTDDGEVELRDYFVLVASNPLVRFANTILTYPAALALRQGFGPVLAAWDAVDAEARTSALIHAHSNLSRLRYRVSTFGNGGLPSDYAGYGTGTDDVFAADRRVRLQGMTADKFAALPDTFTAALKRAQLVEADTILGGDLIGSKRQQGVISETIGESSVFFQSKPVLDLPVGRRAFAILRPFVTISVSVGR